MVDFIADLRSWAVTLSGLSKLSAPTIPRTFLAPPFPFRSARFRSLWAHSHNPNPALVAGSDNAVKWLLDRRRMPLSSVENNLSFRFISRGKGSHRKKRKGDALRLSRCPESARTRKDLRGELAQAHLSRSQPPLTRLGPPRKPPPALRIQAIGGGQPLAGAGEQLVTAFGQSAD